MKLLIYSHFFAPSVGGVETIVALLARKLTESHQAQRNSTNEKWEIIVATKTPANGFDDRTFPFRVVRSPSLLQLWRLIRQSDVIHIAGPSLAPMFLAKFAGKPYVVEHHGYQAICPNGVLIHQPDRAICPGHFQAANYGACVRCQRQEMSAPNAVAKLLLMFPRYSLSRKADLNIAITNHSLQRHQLPRAQTIYYGIDPIQQNDIQESSAPSNPRASENDAPTFAYVGRLVPEKGLEVLLRAAALLKNDSDHFQVLLIGDGPERARLEALIASSDLQDVARITGFLRGSVLTAQMNHVDAVVMPSTWEETAGLSAIEQMMRGRLVLASDIGGLGEIVGDVGLKFPPGDAQRLADQMKKVLDEPSTVATLNQAAQTRAHSLFHADRMTSDHVAAYRDLL